MLKIIELAATVGTLVGLYFISEGHAFGFAISMFSNMSWIYWGHEKNAGGIIIVNAIMIFLNLNGLGAI